MDALVIVEMNVSVLWVLEEGAMCGDCGCGAGSGQVGRHSHTPEGLRPQSSATEAWSGQAGSAAAQLTWGLPSERFSTGGAGRGQAG